MSSIFYLKDRALLNVQLAVDDLSLVSSELYGRNDALTTLKDIHSKLSHIDLDAYLSLKKNNTSTSSYFDKPVRALIDRINGKNILDVPHDINNMLKTQSESEAPDKQILAQIYFAKKHLRSAYRNLRLLQNSRLRILMSGWAVSGIFAIALLYAIGYFVFAKSGVSHPLSQGGAGKILESAKTSALDLRVAIGGASDVLDVTKTLIKKLTDLISAVPALLVVIGSVYAAFRKFLI